MSLLYLLQLLVGFFGLVLIALPFSQNLKNVNYKSIGIGIIFQIVLAILLLKVPLIVDAFKFLGDGVIALQNATAKGTSFLFGFLSSPALPFSLEDPSVQVQSAYFAFGILPFILVMSALTAWLWHIKVLKIIVDGFSKICQRLFNIGGPIGLGAAANVFVGQVEAPLVIRPYLSKLSKKEILILLTAGMSTVAGSIMVALVSMLNNQFPDIVLIQHLITASIISVPAAIIYANILMPSNEITQFDDSELPKLYNSQMDAVTRGTRDGLEIALSVGAILIVFITFVALFDSLLGLIHDDLSLQVILGYIFAPICWLMGIPWEEAIIAGQLLGVKTALNEFVAYSGLASLEPGLLSEQSKLITLYALCGFANFSSVGILIAGVGAMAPDRRSDIVSVSFKALIGATLASCMTGLVVACVNLI
ncbi:MAG: nucleoside transporter C-terminal domain-containing protein [Pseudomonadota bacterium]|jgi:CNT family concentrative nucleoside transporter|nr:nucleoside transporter C-terminal domain-containing protein [Pseudomonadota bacterium]|tara:strand:- start:106 stop:1368 length:1263 start_codon:yes stop_codon:yes gene_type:complete